MAACRSNERWILLEKRNSSDDDNISSYDCMGCSNDEASAVFWRNKNREYRAFLYCPDREVQMNG